MFSSVCARIKESVYGLRGKTINGQQMSFATGTAFMVAPGILATVAHCLYVNNKFSQPLHQNFEVIRSPDIGQTTESATVIGVDQDRDIALLRIPSPRSTASVMIHRSRPISSGTSCGSIGFPLSTVATIPGTNQVSWGLVERFQGSNVSSFKIYKNINSQPLHIYETDSLMYSGSSGCPVFLTNGEVFAIHFGSVNDSVAGGAPSNRLAISLWVPIDELINLAASHNITI